MQALNEIFTLDRKEDFLLKGDYKIETFYNNHEDANSLEEVEEYQCMAVFHKGNVLYKEDEPKILDYINLIIKMTYTKPDQKVEIDQEQQNGRNVLPQSVNICEVDDKVFTLFARYEYAYYVNFNKVTFRSKISKSSKPRTKSSKIQIELRSPAVVKKERVCMYDYNYAFKIIDKNTNILYAFGLYR